MGLPTVVLLHLPPHEKDVCPVQILDAMNQDSELPLASLRVDGGMTVNHTLLQLQADLLGIPVGEERERGRERGGGHGW